MNNKRKKLEALGFPTADELATAILRESEYLRENFSWRELVDDPPTECERCGGDGEIIVGEWETPAGDTERDGKECPDCGGKGHYDDGTSDKDDACGDCRLQVHAGTWAFLTGDASYDQDHRGWWGASCVPYVCDEAAARDIAEELIEQAADQAAQEGVDVDDGPDTGGDSETEQDGLPVDSESGTITGFSASHGSGIAFLEVGGVPIPCDNGATVRALNAAYDGFIVGGHSVDPTVIIGNEIAYSTDCVGVLEGFTPIG